MSITATILGIQPFIAPPGTITAYDADKYRPQQKAQPIVKPPEKAPWAAPIQLLPKVHNMVAERMANRTRIRFSVLSGHNTQPAIHAATQIGKAAIFNHVKSMVEAGELTVDLNTWPREYKATARLLLICEVES